MKFFLAFMFWNGILNLTESKDVLNSTFIATNEWQEIPEGMAIPAGLHVRINLETRKREAKLLDKINEEIANSAIAVQANDANKKLDTSSDKKKILLSDALKNLEKERLHLKFSAEELSQIKRKYKEQQNYANTYDRMKEHFQLESEIISLLIKDLKKLTSTESMKSNNAEELSKQQIEILENLNDMLHQIDNSLLFISQGGLDLLLPIVANESLPLRAKAIHVLGVLTHNNPKAQMEVFERNFATHLLKVLIDSTNSEELSITLYAFGSLIRKFPLAQNNLLPTSGTKALIAVLNKNCELKVKAKVVNLITDLLEEHKEMSAKDQDVGTEFGEWLKLNAYCETMELILDKEILQFLKQPDLCENFVEAIKVSHSLCNNVWLKSSKLKDALITLKEHFKLDANEYYREVGENISNLLLILRILRHEEL